MKFQLGLFFLLLALWATLPAICQERANFWTTALDSLPPKVGYLPGSFRFQQYDSLIRGKRLALVVNHTAEYRGKHLVDTLLARGINIRKIFAPEHGFRGTAAAGEYIQNGTDLRTGLPLVSLYGKNKKPSPEVLADIDLVLFDIQDVGARFYTFISTMKLVMEACAENGKEFLVCDRANPLGFCSGGPVLKPKYASFVGAFPLPVVHGLTVAELAIMAKKKNWFHGAEKLHLYNVKCEGYRHSDSTFPALPPSPNLRTPLAILAYPSLCLFEGTNWSVGRGTDNPFEVFGFPDSTSGEFTFTPSGKQVHSGKVCYGRKLSRESIDQCFSLRFLVEARKRRPGDAGFFNSFFEKLAGSRKLRQLVERGKEYQSDMDAWEKEKAPFLLYP